MKRIGLVFYSCMLICISLHHIVLALPPYTPQYYLKPAGLTLNSYFGNSISVSENATYLAVAAYQHPGGGAVQLYTRSVSTGQYTWNPSNFILSPTNSSAASFGNHIKVNENILLVGSPGVELVYVYVLNPTLTVNQTASISPSQIILPPTSAGGSWGRRVGLYNSTLVIAGDQAVVIYRCNLRATSNICTQAGTLNNPGNITPFGERLAIWNNTVVVASFSRFNSTGVVYLYNLPTNSSGNFSIDPYQTIYSPAAATFANNQFGKSIDIRASALVVGAAFENNRTGNVYYYRLNSTNQATFSAVFTLPNSTTYFNQSTNATMYNTYNYTNIGQLGQAVALYNDQLLIGASGLGAGSILLYNTSLPSAAPMVYTPSIASGSNSNSFGFAVSLQNGIIAVGASGDDSTPSSSTAVTYLSSTASIPSSASKTNRSGAAYVFSPSCAYTSVPNSYNHPLYTCATNFSAVAISEDTVITSGSQVTFGYMNGNTINGNLVFLSNSGMTNLTLYGDNNALVISGCMSNPQNVNLILDLSSGSTRDALLRALNAKTEAKVTVEVIIYRGGLCNMSATSNDDDDDDGPRFNNVMLVNRAGNIGGCAPILGMNNVSYSLSETRLRVIIEVNATGCEGQVIDPNHPSPSATHAASGVGPPPSAAWLVIIIVIIVGILLLMVAAGIVSRMRMMSAGGEGDEASRLNFGH